MGPFTGDVSDIVSRELAKVYEAMIGSESSRIIICVNKTALHLKDMRRELSDYGSPIDYMKDRYISKLNEHFSDKNIQVKKEHIFFTDWKAGQEARDFGIESIEDIKELIKQYLVERMLLKGRRLKNLKNQSLHQ